MFDATKKPTQQVNFDVCTVTCFLFVFTYNAIIIFYKYPPLKQIVFCFFLIIFKFIKDVQIAK